MCCSQHTKPSTQKWKRVGGKEIKRTTPWFACKHRHKSILWTMIKKQNKKNIASKKQKHHKKYLWFNPALNFEQSWNKVIIGSDYKSKISSQWTPDGWKLGRFIINFSDRVKDKPIHLIAYRGLVFLQSKRAEINYQKYDTSSLNHSNSESKYVHH